VLVASRPLGPCRLGWDDPMVGVLPSPRRTWAGAGGSVSRWARRRRAWSALGGDEARALSVDALGALRARV